MQKLGIFKARWITSFIIGLVILFLSLPVLAVETGGVGGKPANPRADNPRSDSIFVYELKPGQEINDAIRIYNNTEQAKTINVYATDSIISSGGAFACAQAADTIKEVGGWIKLENSSLNLSSKQNNEIKFILTVPKDAEPGEHNGCIAIQEQKPASVNGGNGVALSTRSAIRVAITIPGQLKKELTYKGITTRLQGDKIITSVLLRNNGNVSLDATITTTLKNAILGSNNGSVQGTYPTLPKTITELNFEFKRPFWGGLYRVNSQASYNSNQNQSLGQGSNNKTESYSSGLVFVQPKLEALLIELAVLFALLYLAYLLWQKYWVLPKLVKTYHPHKVKKDEDLQSIAKKYNTDWKHLAKANRLKAPFNTDVNSIILVPNKDNKYPKKRIQKGE